MIIVIPTSPERTTYQINKAYVDYIFNSGYTPWIVTPHTDPDTLVNGNVGLLLPGGKDLDPIYYGDNNCGSQASDPDKDKFERNLLHAFIKKGKPIFGICRGFQLIVREYILANPEVSLDLLYKQHIEAHTTNHNFNLSRTIPSHYIKARIDLLYGNTEKTVINSIPVNSMHHQYLHVYKPEDELEKTSMITPYLQLTGWTTRGLDPDEVGVVAEGIIIKDWGKSKIAGVQWHPEELEDYNLIKNHFGEV
ncbi:MAG: hypothetical protein DRO67_07550 [Candidatus Asgardarchaeum californiense]|nr:MAG: hypothetical protein DRO67_07550 [Candidatus Asgardarchaeum californiense]